MNAKLIVLALALNVCLISGQLLIPGQRKLIAGRSVLNGGLIANAGLIRAPLLRTGGIIAGAPALVPQQVVAAGPALTTAGLLGTYRVSGGLGLHGLGLGTLGVIRGHAAYTGPVSAAVETLRTHQVVDVPTSQDVITPSTIIVEPNVLPVNIEFRSQSSPVNPTQVHIPGRPGTVQQTQSEEEPDILRHEVVKPIVQEVRETIVPFRRITQEILPVQEEVHSLVARGQRQQVIAQDQLVAGRVAVAQPALAVAQPALAVAQPAIAVAQPALGTVAAAGPVGVVEEVVGAPGQLVSTGINRFGGAVLGKNLELIKARS